MTEQTDTIADTVLPDPAPEGPDVTEATDASETAEAGPEDTEDTEVPEVTEAPVPAASGATRRVLWAVARWTAAVVVCGGLGAGTALGITSMERTDVPGLATEHDGRWEYPTLRLPALPQGSPRPFSEGNDGEVHHADLRALLLPAPAGATVDPKRNGGWVALDQYLSLYRQDDRAALKEALADSALRHVAARGWTTPDGTTTRIHLLRFNSVAFAEAFKDDALKAGSVDGPLLEGVEGVQMESALASAVGVPYTALYSFVELPTGSEQTRWAYIQAGDTVALVTQSRKGDALLVPFEQTVTLQNQLLG
ncbi:hypothetical protein J7E93_32120 [Streptomyces sp. ISL-36]|uniref:hypothetical protein n=1 Tax=Streptomyces sp. ISL-36 TaxID=2819182 RepID=UPI001BE9F9E4|nr:hypothetical protein [Streptomyces sp. ISL-36]MBT2444661.1 hypothetical protein [Streptomyces sp. ISL-36]